MRATFIDVPEDPRAKLFFDQWEKDTHEGITLRSVHNRLTGHIDRTEERFRGHSSEMKKIGERVATVEQNDKRDAEDRANQTGRHNTPGGMAIPTPVQPFPVPFPMPSQPGAVVHVHGAQGGQGGQGGSVGGDYIGPGAQVSTASGSGAHIIPPPAMAAAAPPATKTPSWPPKWMRPPLQKVLAYGLVATVTALGTTLVHLTAAPAQPPERIVYLPAPAPVETVPSALAIAPSVLFDASASFAPASPPSAPAAYPPHRAAH